MEQIKATLLVLLVLLTTTFVQIPVEYPEYNRKNFRHWVDVDRDCHDTRQEVLINESICGVVYEKDNPCRVKFGMWHGKFYDTLIYNPKKLDVDHHVPLKNAWISGAWKWDKEKLKRYANDLVDPDHLIAVSSSANRSKGAKSPDQWLPKNKRYIHEYCRIWNNIKLKWGLTVTRDELETLKSVLQFDTLVFPEVRD